VENLFSPLLNSTLGFIRNFRKIFSPTNFRRVTRVFFTLHRAQTQAWCAVGFYISEGTTVDGKDHGCIADELSSVGSLSLTITYRIFVF
jgi:hypothetical protein